MKRAKEEPVKLVTEMPGAPQRETAKRDARMMVTAAALYFFGGPLWWGLGVIPAAVLTGIVGAFCARVCFELGRQYEADLWRGSDDDEEETEV